MRMVHRCDNRLYSAGEAEGHPHSRNPGLCPKGWRAASPLEEKLADDVAAGSGVMRGRMEHLVLFDDASLPANRSTTMALSIAEVSPEAVRAHIEAKRAEFRKSSLAGSQ